MNKNYIVYLVTHEHVISDKNISTIDIGFYDCLANAEKAISFSVQLPGFSEVPLGYRIIPFILDKVHWTSGFTEFIGESCIPQSDPVGIDDQPIIMLEVEKVFVLYHFFEHGEERNFEDEVRYIGVFSSEDKMNEAISILKNKDGFKDYVEYFSGAETVLNQTKWLSGFATI